MKRNIKKKNDKTNIFSFVKALRTIRHQQLEVRLNGKRTSLKEINV